MQHGDTDEHHLHGVDGQLKQQQRSPYKATAAGNTGRYKFPSQSMRLASRARSTHRVSHNTSIRLQKSREQTCSRDIVKGYMTQVRSDSTKPRMSATGARRDTKPRGYKIHKTQHRQFPHSQQTFTERMVPLAMRWKFTTVRSRCR